MMHRVLHVTLDFVCAYLFRILTWTSKVRLARSRCLFDFCNKISTVQKGNRVNFGMLFHDLESLIRDYVSSPSCDERVEQHRIVS